VSNKIKRLHTEISSVRNKRYKLLFLTSEESNQSSIINDLKRDGMSTININLYLSDQLRLISSDKRPYEVVKWLRQAINEQKNDFVLLHNIEYLFDPELKQNPVKLLEALSGNTVLLVLWPGKEEHGVLNYATPEHPEYYQNDEYSNCIFTY
jgi:hypothetical protein